MKAYWLYDNVHFLQPFCGTCLRKPYNCVEAYESFLGEPG